MLRFDVVQKMGEGVEERAAVVGVYPLLKQGSLPPPSAPGDVRTCVVRGEAGSQTVCGPPGEEPLC